MKPASGGLLESTPAPALLAAEADAGLPGGEASLRTWIQDVLQLTKVRVSLLVLITTVAGFVLGAAQAGMPADPWALLQVVAGTAMVAAAAAAINQYLERDLDARMERTRERPLPAGRLTPQGVLGFGAILAAAGLLVLGLAVNRLACGIAALTLAIYLGLYTPLKRRTHLSTVVGAFPGALPPLIGWAGATSGVSEPAWILFGILFFWQLPHFLGIAWLHREDYARGGFPLLTVIDPSGRAASCQALTNTVALVATSLLPFLTRQNGAFYLTMALALGLGFLSLAVWLAASRTTRSARALVIGSIVYLPLLLIAMVLDGRA